MNDRELLELAAKAAGYSYGWSDRYDCTEVWNIGDKNKRFWQPHRDDGDALRLAVKLGIRIGVSDKYANADFWERPSMTDLRTESVPIGDDANAALRLATVLAAAEIGKAMP